MLKKIIYIFIILIVIQAKLQYVYSMIRDGASYSKYDSYNEKKTTDMKNYVTTVGMRQLYNLGSYVKQIYINEEKLTTTKFAPSQV